MNERQHVLAVVTARGGSKGLPGKNLRELGGKPLIAWTIEAGLQSRRIDRLILSTDDEEIAEVGRRFGADVPFIRPAELATDTSHHPEVMIHAAQFVAEDAAVDYDVILLLQPTVPFRTGAHIDQSIELFLRSGAESLIALKTQDYPPWWMFQLEGERIRPAFEWKPGVNVFNMERQEFPAVYRPNGAIYLTWTQSLIVNKRLVDPADCAYFIMDQAASVDIDTLTDFTLAEAMLADARRSDRGG